jgi:transcriptional regulator with XRE-family HTH domain
VRSALAENLKSTIKERKLSIKTSAEICSVAQSVFHGWLNGAQCNDPNALLRFCESLNVDFQWLLTGKVSNFEPSKMGLNEIFDIEEDPTVSGLFLIEAKRLKRRHGKAS